MLAKVFIFKNKSLNLNGMEIRLKINEIQTSSIMTKEYRYNKDNKTSDHEFMKLEFPSAKKCRISMIFLNQILNFNVLEEDIMLNTLPHIIKKEFKKGSFMFVTKIHIEKNSNVQSNLKNCIPIVESDKSEGEMREHIQIAKEKIKFIPKNEINHEKNQNLNNNFIIINSNMENTEYTTAPDSETKKLEKLQSDLTITPSLIDLQNYLNKLAEDFKVQNLEQKKKDNQIEKEFKEIKEEVNGLKEKNTKLEEKNTKLEEKNTKLEEKNAKLEEEIQGLKTDIKELKKKTRNLNLRFFIENLIQILHKEDQNLPIQKQGKSNSQKWMHIESYFILGQKSIYEIYITDEGKKFYDVLHSEINPHVTQTFVFGNIYEELSKTLHASSGIISSFYEIVFDKDCELAKILQIFNKIVFEEKLYEIKISE